MIRRPDPDEPLELSWGELRLLAEHRVISWADVRDAVRERARRDNGGVPPYFLLELKPKETRS